MLRSADAPATPAPRALRLAPATLAVLLGAADTYVVVLALPDMVTGVGLSIEDLAGAAPIVSGFLLGYVSVLPLAGRVSDVAGRSPVLVTCLLGFALGSLVTASATTLPVAVAGRSLQGLGAGGLVPPTLALVADLWGERDRGLPLGLVGAAQELGAVLGPLLGAAVLAASGWRAIFWLNLAAALLVVAVAVVAAPAARTGRLPDADLPGVLLLAAALAGIVLTFAGAETTPSVVDVPVFARVTRFPTSQLSAALVLLEFLAALPVGALAGGWALRRVPARAVAGGGLGVAALALTGTRWWDANALYGAPAQLLLVAAGLGFGLTVAPVNAVLLAATPAPVHGLASALAVLARTVGMLVGLSVLTAVGLRVFEARQAALPSPFVMCPASPGDCPAYVAATRVSVVGELQAVFGGAAVALALAVVVVLWLRAGRPLPASGTPETAGNVAGRELGW